jgi:hypothetical protein
MTSTGKNSIKQTSLACNHIELGHSYSCSEKLVLLDGKYTAIRLKSGTNCDRDTGKSYDQHCPLFCDMGTYINERDVK